MKFVKKFNNCIIINDEQLTIDYKHKSKYCSDVILTTKLIVDKVNNNLAYGKVFWSSAKNVIRKDNEGNWILGIDSNYLKIIIEWNNNLLFDEKYIKSVMTDLLDKERVSECIEGRVEEYKYIGGIRKIEDQYRTVYDKDIENELFYLPMKLKR